MVQRLLKVLSTYIGSRECCALAASCTECISDLVVLNEGAPGGAPVDIVTAVSFSMNSVMQSRDACILALVGLKGLIRSFSLVDYASVLAPLTIQSDCKSAVTAHLFTWSRKLHVEVIASAVNAGTVDMLLACITLNGGDIEIMTTAADCLSWMMVGHESTNLQEFLALNITHIVKQGISALRTCLTSANSSRCVRAWCRFFTSMLTDGGMWVPGQFKICETRANGCGAKLAMSSAATIMLEEDGVSTLQALPLRFGHDPKVLRCIIQLQSALGVVILRSQNARLYPCCNTGEVWQAMPSSRGKPSGDERMHCIDPIACEFVNFLHDKAVRAEDESAVEWAASPPNATFEFGSLNSCCDVGASMLALCASAGQFKLVSRALPLLCLWLGGVAQRCRLERVRAPLQVQVIRKLGSSIRDLCHALCSACVVGSKPSAQQPSFGHRASSLAALTCLFSASIAPENCSTADVSTNVTWQLQPDDLPEAAKLWGQLFMGEGSDEASAAAAAAACEPTEHELLFSGMCALVRQLALLGPAARLAVGVSSTVEGLCSAVCALQRSAYAIFSQSQAVRALLLPTGKQTAQVHLSMDVFLPIRGEGVCQTSLFLFLVSMLARSRNDAAVFGSALGTLAQALYSAQVMPKMFAYEVLYNLYAFSILRADPLIFQRCFVRVKMTYTSSTLVRGLQLPFGNGPSSRAFLKLSPKLPVRGGVLLSPTTAPAPDKPALAFPSKQKAVTKVESTTPAAVVPSGVTGVVALLAASRARREFERQRADEIQQQRSDGTDATKATPVSEELDREAAAAAAQEMLQQAAAAEAAAFRAAEAKKGLPQNVLKAIAVTSKILLTPTSFLGFARGGVDDCATDLLWDGLAALPWRAHLVASLARDAGESGDAVFSIGRQVAAFADGNAVFYMTMCGMHLLETQQFAFLYMT